MECLGDLGWAEGGVESGFVLIWIICVRRRGSLLDLGSGELAGIDMLPVGEGDHGLLIPIEPIGLGCGPRIPVQPEPFECMDGLVDGPGFDPWGIEVLNS